MSTLTKPKSLEKLEDEIKQLELTLPHKLWLGTYNMYLYQGFWCPVLKPTIYFQSHFQANDTDIILASLPKTGTTWSKSLIFSIVNRKEFSDVSKHPLHAHNPHELVLHFEYKLYTDYMKGCAPDFTKLPSPRLFATHVPYPSLPNTIKTSKCKIIYVCRNPLDTFISSWHFFLEVERNESLTPNMIEDYFGKFCKGDFPFCPYEDHIVGYWKESMATPDKVLFMEYEGLKEDSNAQVRRLVEFLGCPFSEEEEKENVIDEIIKLCSLDSLKQMEVNKSGKFYDFVENKALFRKGEVGDWTNYLTPSMLKEHYQVMQEKFKRSGLLSDIVNKNFHK
ncbi:cytosolic sulfotransferase 15 [Beta vulgaris subsp. vulgaris]|uniref:cytosolic sulfotransferase 15 n=1 Tax=Beta vulgaris subsp. vulgaris TaxID=3555 RepID=UPI0025495A2E|nr:cytosolic sulfotransferase 15 [Beta vulgaris subsp. vulgaris]